MLIWAMIELASAGTCSFLADGRPATHATCGSFETLSVKCTTDGLNASPDQVVGLRTHLSHLEVYAITDEWLYDTFKGKFGKEASASLVGSGRSQFVFGDAALSMADLCTVPRKERRESIDVEVSVVARKQSGYQDQWIESTGTVQRVPIYDGGYTVSAGKLTLSQLPPFTGAQDKQATIEVPLLDGEHQSFSEDATSAYRYLTVQNDDNGVGAWRLTTLMLNETELRERYRAEMADADPYAWVKAQVDVAIGSPPKAGGLKGFMQALNGEAGPKDALGAGVPVVPTSRCQQGPLRGTQVEERNQNGLDGDHRHDSVGASVV